MSFVSPRFGVRGPPRPGEAIGRFPSVSGPSGTLIPVDLPATGMSLAAETRAAVRARPFLRDALRAGVVNYAAAARHLEATEDALAGSDEETITAALRRYAEDLDPYAPPAADADRVRVTMQRGLGPTDDTDAALLRVGDTLLAADAGNLTAVTATGDGIGPRALAYAVDRLDGEGVAVGAAGATDGVVLVVVGGRDGPDTLRIVEDAIA